MAVASCTIHSMFSPRACAVATLRPTSRPVEENSTAFTFQPRSASHNAWRPSPAARSIALPGASEGALTTGALTAGQPYLVEVSGKRFDVRVRGEAFAPNGSAPTASRPVPRRERKAGGATATPSGDALISPLQGNIFKLLVEQGAEVEEGALICIIEAMKMENEITAHKAGTVAELPISEGAAVASGDTLAVIR